MSSLINIMEKMVIMIIGDGVKGSKNVGSALIALEYMVETITKVLKS